MVRKVIAYHFLNRMEQFQDKSTVRVRRQMIDKKYGIIYDVYETMFLREL